MKILIAILSCHSLRYCEDSERQTWIKELPAGVDYKFFHGLPEIADADEDEVVLDVGDKFDDITAKSVAVHSWAYAHGYDFVYKCDLDTLVRPNLLLSSGFERHDYTGGNNSGFASGGSGYWLSRRAMKAVIDCKGDRSGPAEDVYVWKACSEARIPLFGDPRYKYYPGDVMDDRTISYHLSSIRSWGKIAYDPQWMFDTWEDQKNRVYKQYGQEPLPIPVAVNTPHRPLRRLR